MSRTPALLCAVILALCTRPAPVPSRSRMRCDADVRPASVGHTGSGRSWVWLRVLQEGVGTPATFPEGRRTRDSVRTRQRRRTGSHAGDKARICSMIAYALPVREGQRRVGAARMAHAALDHGPSPPPRPGTCWPVHRPGSQHAVVPHAPQRCASWRCGARTPLGRHPPHGRQRVGGCCVVLPPRPPCLPVILPTGLSSFF